MPLPRFKRDSTNAASANTTGTATRRTAGSSSTASFSSRGSRSSSSRSGGGDNSSSSNSNSSVWSPRLYSNYSTMSIPDSGFWTQDFMLGASMVVIQPSSGKVVVVNDTARRAWFLPRGRKDIGESLEQCALREAYEEVRTSVRYPRPAYLPAFPPSLSLPRRFILATSGPMDAVERSSCGGLTNDRNLCPPPKECNNEGRVEGGEGGR